MTLTTPVIFGRAVGRPDERVNITSIAKADPSVADMATLVIVGSAQTRLIERPGRSRFLMQDLVHQSLAIRSVEDGPQRQQLVQCCAKRINVRAVIQQSALAADLLRAHIA